MRSRQNARLAGVLVVALIALVAAGTSPAINKGGGTVTTALWKHRDSCTLDPKRKVTGTATFTKKGGIVTLSVKMHGADPGTWYLYLYTGDCNDSWTLGKFKVDASGDGSKTGSADVSGFGNKFFAAPYNNDTGDYDESDIVSL